MYGKLKKKGGGLHEWDISVTSYPWPIING